MTETKTAPKTFISYSWTTPAHEEWVLQFASNLRASRVDAILDKWDLKEGHDGHEFMEQMVTNDGVRKVILICDKGYVSKANARSDGVGTETQIITPEIYKNQAQDKFVAVVTERDEKGNPYLPAFYGSRIYIDFSDEGKYVEKFDRLLRWIFDKPLHEKPPLGEEPSFLSGDALDSPLATSLSFQRARDALRNDRDNALALVIEYFELLASELEKLRIHNKEGEHFDDLVVRSIESFLPYRNEATEIFILLARSKHQEEIAKIVRRLFEKLIPYFMRPRDALQWSERNADNYIFIIHELFLYALACFIDNEQFNTCATLMNTEYYCPEISNVYNTDMISFEIFRQHVQSLGERNERLNLRRLSLRADLLEQRSRGSNVDFRTLMQVDFVLYLKDHLDRPDNYFNWWPETLLYASNQYRAFEIFARSKSARYFENIKLLLGIEDKVALGTLLSKIRADAGGKWPSWEFHSIDPRRLAGYDQLGTVA